MFRAGMHSIFFHDGNFFDRYGRKLTKAELYGESQDEDSFTTQLNYHEELRGWCDGQLSSFTDSHTEDSDDEDNLFSIFLLLKEDTSITAISQKLPEQQGRIEHAIRLCLIRNQILLNMPEYADAIKELCARHGLYQAKKSANISSQSRQIDDASPLIVKTFARTVRNFSKIYAPDNKPTDSAMTLRV